MSETLRPRTINIVAAALGGEGGGVFTNWLLEVALANNWLAQATSLAGVAQRTGATIYYIELFLRDETQLKPPIMSLFPAQGDIDIAISSEIAEAGRMLQRGFVTPERTTLISSTHRVYGITEKSNLADGTIDAQAVQQIAAKYAKAFICYDMQELANSHNAVISAVLLGALAGSELLPFGQQSFVDVIRKTDKAIATNLAAFEASYQAAMSSRSQAHQQNTVQHFSVDGTQPAPKNNAFRLPAGQSRQGTDLLNRLQNNFPESTHFVLYHGLKKTLEYQDFAYADQYLDELAGIIGLDKNDEHCELTNITARHLALWMCFEDIARVAQLKIRTARMDEIRTETKADTKQIIYVTEYFRPRPEEICAILPAAMGSWLLSSKLCRNMLKFLFGGGKKLTTNKLFTYLTLRFLAMFRRFRRISLGWRQEHLMIQAWLTTIKHAAQTDQMLAIELARCGDLVKGYGKTRERTTGQLVAIVEKTASISKASTFVQLRAAALADDDNSQFQKLLNNLP